MNCEYCLKYTTYKYPHPSLRICSLDCLINLMKKNNIKFDGFNLKVMPQKGRGKHLQTVIDQTPPQSISK